MGGWIEEDFQNLPGFPKPSLTFQKSPDFPKVLPLSKSPPTFQKSPDFPKVIPEKFKEGFDVISLPSHAKFLA
jgi:hypothetical protein